MRDIESRIDLAKHFAELGFKKGAEIGVYEGHYSKILLDNIPDLKLFCVDDWNEGNYRRKAYPIAVKVLEDYPDVIIIRKVSIEAAKEVEDESLDFIFIDAAHDYKNVKADIEAWSKKVKVGGILSGHDMHKFHFSRNTGVLDAVNEFVKKNDIELNIIDWYKKTSDKNDQTPCWWFVKDKEYKK